MRHTLATAQPDECVLALGEEVVRVAREMRQRGLVAATMGNVSARLGNTMLITPTRHDYDELHVSDVVLMRIDDRRLAPARGTPSLEWRVHAAVYRARSDVGAIVHTHSPYATARSFDHSPLVVETEECDYLELDRICVVTPHAAGTAALAAAVVTVLGTRPALLLARHGVVAVGGTPREALEMSCVVEHQALIDHIRRSSTPRAW
jgi:L-fuculose-phosphate aldolase